MKPAIVKCYVDESSDYPTHRPLCIQVLTKLLEFNVKELRRPTNFASMLEQNSRMRSKKKQKHGKKKYSKGTIATKEKKTTTSELGIGKNCTKPSTIS